MRESLSALINKLKEDGVKYITVTHDLNPKSRYHKIVGACQIQTNIKEVIIDDDCWIAGGSVILPGVHIVKVLSLVPVA